MAGPDLTHDHADGDAHAPDAGPPTHDEGVHRDAFELGHLGLRIE
jgi:hypothetical protein